MFVLLIFILYINDAIAQIMYRIKCAIARVGMNTKWMVSCAVVLKDSFFKKKSPAEVNRPGRASIVLVEVN